MNKFKPGDLAVRVSVKSRNLDANIAQPRWNDPSFPTFVCQKGRWEHGIRGVKFARLEVLRQPHGRSAAEPEFANDLEPPIQDVARLCWMEVL